MRFAGQALFPGAARVPPRFPATRAAKKCWAPSPTCVTPGERQGALRQAISLGYNGNRLRWLRATGGSVSQTFRQGIAWGVVAPDRPAGRTGDLRVGQAALASLGSAFLPPALPTGAGLCDRDRPDGRLVGGVRPAGLRATEVGAGATRSWSWPGSSPGEVACSLSYGGHFSWPFTLNFFLPALLPLLCAFVWPDRAMRFSLPLIALILIVASLIPAAQARPMERGNVTASSVARPGVMGDQGRRSVLSRLSSRSAWVSQTPGGPWPERWSPSSRWSGRPCAEGLGNPFSAAFLMVALIPMVAVLLAFRARRRAVPAG